MVLEASDKVALIIANRNYQILDLGLRTPLSDAETLAEKLQEMNFKTVVLADLTLDEMKRMIVEFTNLLSDNVYAVFYFVGHGFQINGQCFLLPINNLIDMYLPEHCLPMNWILHKFMEFNTGMHVILLDICRYEEPVNPLEFHLRAKQIFKIPQKIPVKPNTIFGFATSTGGSSYEVVGEKNGVFMKYLKHHLSKDIPVLSMLQKVFRDVQNDPLISHVQVPEFTCNLAYPRRLTDPLVTTGYTQTFNVHNLTWCNMHRLPDPVTLGVDADTDICITIWIDFCGHFTNKCYIYSNVCKKEIENEDSAELKNNKLAYRACLEFDEPLSVANPRLSEDPSEGVTLSYLVSGLQKVNGKVDCTISLFKVDENDEVMEDNIIMKKTVSLGYILITRLFENE
uniref:CASPASE_P20 domain-containing protein n=1 Tax=Rhabditophanes sp. KR3021 TaxID=114890 RepID=A0AC35U5U3_9BILA